MRSNAADHGPSRGNLKPMGVRMSEKSSPWRTAGKVLGWVCVALGGLGAIAALVFILPSRGEGQDPHGYTLIFGVFLLIVSIPFLLTGLMSVLPRRAALWLSRIVAVLGVLLIVALLVWLNMP